MSYLRHALHLRPRLSEPNQAGVLGITPTVLRSDETNLHSPKLRWPWNVRHLLAELRDAEAATSLRLLVTEQKTEPAAFLLHAWSGL